MPKITREDVAAVEALIDDIELHGLFEALSAVAYEKASHVQEAWGDAALAKRWAKLGDKFSKMAGTIDDPYTE